MRCWLCVVVFQVGSEAVLFEFTERDPVFVWNKHSGTGA